MQPFPVMGLVFSTSAFAASAATSMDNFSLLVTGSSITQRVNSYVITDVSVIGAVSNTILIRPL